jgi:hypothetical protein
VAAQVRHQHAAPLREPFRRSREQAGADAEAVDQDDRAAAPAELLDRESLAAIFAARG